MRRAGALRMGSMIVHTRYLLLLLFQGGLLWVCPAVRCQEIKPDAPEPPSSSAVQEVLPRGLYLRNERGVLVYVPDYPYEQFEQLLKSQHNPAIPPRPAFDMKEMVIKAVATGDRLEMDVAFSLEGRQLEGVAEGTWYSVPLRFGKAYLRKEPGFEGPGGHFLTFDEQQGGYVCWLQMSPDAIHQVSLPLVAPISRVGEQSRCALETPSPLASTLTIRVDENPAEGTIRELTDETGRPLAFTVTPEGHGLFSARGIRGDVSVSWHRSRATEERADVGLDVFGTVIVTADELLQELRSDGRFVVRGLGGPLEHFQVRLPPGMRLRESPEPGYKVQPLKEEAAGEGGCQLLEIRFDRPVTGETHIRLIAELPSNQEDPSWPLTVAKLVDAAKELEPARFEFLGAAKHRGQIDLVVNGDWALQWVDDPEFSRVEATGPATPGSGLAARFRYHNQNGALRVSIRQKAARISVEPTYDVYVDARQARLFADLECRTSGSKAGPLAIRLPGWTVEIVKFADVDSPLPVDMNDVNPLVVPVPVESQAAGRFRLQIEARQDLTASVVSGTSPLRIVLPMVEAENPTRANLIVSPGTITVIPADNVLLTPRPQQMQALSALVIPLSTNVDTPPPTVPGAEPPSGPLESNGYETAVFRYRDRGATEQGVFVGDFKVQPQSISVSVSSTVTVDRRSYGVEQRLSYMVLHEAVDTLELVVPPALADSEQRNLRILLDDQPLTPTSDNELRAGRVPMRVRLPQPMLGPIEMRIVHPPQAIAQLDAEQEVKLSIPLVFPAARGSSNTAVIGNTLTVLHRDPVRVAPAGGAWTAEEGESESGKLVLTTASDASDATLNVSLRGAGLDSSTILDQVWIQTWISGTEQRDRVVLRCRTSEPQLTVYLPQQLDIDSASIVVAVDNRKVFVEPPDEASPRELTIPISATGSVEQHVIEMWYRLAEGRPRRGRMTLEPARLDAVDHVQRCYWQLILPRGEVVAWGNQDMSAELIWENWFGWRRRPLLLQADLERWIGAARQDPIPPGTNSYLFTGFGVARQLEVVTISRTGVMLGASSLALVIGLLLMYLPGLRHPAFLVSAGIALLGFAITVPELSILLGQAASLGILLALLARLVRAVLLRGPAAGPTVRGRTAYADSKLVEVRMPRTDGSSKITTASAPTAVPVPSAESKS